MKNFEIIPPEIRELVLRSGSIAVWPVDPSPLSDSYQIARFFQEEGWTVYPVHDWLERILDVPCYRDIRLIPDDYDILLLFMELERLPEAVNAIFNADYVPPLVWGHVGLVDLESVDRLTESGVLVVMDTNLKEFYQYWRDRM